jgi:tetratricopeptide (TPR) repeat protein
MEAGLDAVALFERALSLRPRSGPALIGLAAAEAAVGRGAAAASRLNELLQQDPMWISGHEQLAQLLSTLGRGAESTISLEQAISKRPHELVLRNALLGLELRRGNFERLRDLVDEARGAGVEMPELSFYEAVYAAERDSTLMPDALFGLASQQHDELLDIWRVRHLLRLGATDAALPILDKALNGPCSAELWPYAATTWKTVADPRAEWLSDRPEFVQIVDLEKELPPLDQLAGHLRTLHLGRGEYLDQSVRGGTQTDGPLFSRVDPLIRHVRAAVVSAVENYVIKLPPNDPRHPLLGQRRGRPVRFSGSWSVRLRSGGKHSNHVHPQGWISSALYISLPPQREGEREGAGWFTIGDPDERLGLTIGPSRTIQPVPGRLVLFPSYLWHGTVPFAEGERLTIAFDVRPPI